MRNLSNHKSEHWHFFRCLSFVKVVIPDVISSISFSKVYTLFAFSCAWVFSCLFCTNFGWSVNTQSRNVFFVAVPHDGTFSCSSLTESGFKELRRHIQLSGIKNAEILNEMGFYFGFYSLWICFFLKLILLLHRLFYGKNFGNNLHSIYIWDDSFMLCHSSG